VPHEPESSRVELSSTTQHVVVWPGASPAVVALHGLAGHAREWDALALSLPGRRVVAPDLRGHGASDRADDYRLGTFARDVADLIERCELAPAVVIGHSLGGAVAMALAAERPDLLVGLVVVDIGPEIPAASLEQLAARQQQRPTTFTDPAAAVASLRATNPFATDDALEHRVRHGLVEAGAGRWSWRHDPALYRPGRPDPADLWDLWTRSSTPALVVRGEHSLYLDEPLAERMAAARQDVDLAVIADSGHNVPTDRPEAFGALVARWMQDAALPRT